MTDSVMVTVNDSSLTRSQAEGVARQLASRQGVPPQMLETFMAQRGQVLVQQAAEQFVNQMLLSEEAQKRDIPVSDDEVEAVITRLSEGLPEGMTIDQALAAQGLTKDKMVADIKANEQIRKLFEAETAAATAPSDADVETFYNENTKHFVSEESVEARHVLIACAEDADEDARAAAKAEAESVRKSLADGADFAETAAAKSTCPSKDNGGSLGSFGRGRMVPAFETAAFSQEIGEISEVVETPFGYHVIEVTAKESAGTQALEEVSESISQHLSTRAKEELFGAFLTQLREGAQIKYAEGFEPATK